METEKLLLNSKTSDNREYRNTEVDEFAQVRLRRMQYLSNLMTTNQMMLRNHNINSLILF